MKTVINFRSFDDDTRDAYAQAWENVGGTMEDVESSTPWCCPWFWEDEQVFDLPECHTMEDIARAMLGLYPEAAASEEENE